MRFSRFRGIFLVLSLLMGVGLYTYTFMVHGGFARSISFNGGVRVSIQLPPEMTKEDLEKGTVAAGFHDPQVRLTNPRMSQYDVELGPEARDQLADEITNENDTVADQIELKLLKAMPELSSSNIVSRETISASYGSDLFGIAMKSFVITVIVIGLYLSFRFDFPFALGASLALVHDVIMTVGFIGAAQLEPNVPLVAAVLTIVGYSINDTIVIFDRIRENMEDHHMSALKSVMDTAITQTLSRTIITSLLTLISVIALLMGGADSLHGFAWVLMFGIVIGTYSSIFVASHFVQYYNEIIAKVRGS